MGEVLGTFQGGFIQGIGSTLRTGIRSIGGRGEVLYRLNDQLHTHAGFGIDDPDDTDLSATCRSQIHFYFASVVYDVTSLFSVGVEVSWWETRFIGLARGEAARIETVMKYRF